METLQEKAKVLSVGALSIRIGFWGRVQGVGCRVQGEGFRVWGSGFRVQGEGEKGVGGLGCT